MKNIEKSEKNSENLKNSINFKKSLGQNFLFDKNLLRAIVGDGLVTKDDVVLEIGAGAGTLTGVLAENAKNSTGRQEPTDVSGGNLESDPKQTDASA